MPWAGFAPCEAILFDLDDTLIDDTGAVERCWQLACAESVAADSGYTTVELIDAVRGVGAWYWSDGERHRVGRADLLAATCTIARLALERLGSPDDHLARTLAARYRLLRDESLALFDGAVEAIVELALAGYTLGLITNGAAAPQRAKLERFDLTRHFAYIGIEGEAGVGKPEPEAFSRALRAIDCAPQDAWMVGDNLEWDVFGAQRLGIRTVWIDRHGRGLPDDAAAQPDHIATSIGELAAAAAR